MVQVNETGRRKGYFFANIMSKFKKVLNFKIISATISVLFLFNSTLYSWPIYRDSLRVPVGQEKTYERVVEVMEKIQGTRGVNRRQFFKIAGKAIGAVALSGLIPSDGQAKSLGPQIQAPLDWGDLFLFFASPASTKLHKEIKEVIDNFDPNFTSLTIEGVKGIILKIELTRRLIEIEIELGMVPDLKITKEEAINAYDNFKNMSIERLNDINDPSIQKVIWEAMANAHPKFKLYYEAVKRLNLDKTGEGLVRESLEELQAHFKMIGTRGRGHEGVGAILKFSLSVFWKVMEEDTKRVLEDLLLFNSLSTHKEILSYTKDLFEEGKYLESSEPPINDDVIKPSVTLVDGSLFRYGNGYKRKLPPPAMSHLIAIALAREGYETYYIIGNGHTEVADAKVCKYEYMVIFKDKPTNDWYAIDTCNFMHKKGLKVENGLYKIKDVENLQKELDFKAMYKINAQELSLLPRSIKRHLEIRDKRAYDTYYYLDSFRLAWYGSFSNRSYENIKDIIAEGEMELYEQFIKKYKIIISLDVEPEQRALAKETFVEAILLLPEKFIARLKEMRFKKKIPIDRTVVTGVDSTGNLIYSKIKEAGGSYIGGKVVEQADIAIRTTVHELLHMWEDVSPKEIIEIFYNISWENDKLRTVDNDRFARPYGMNNKREDLATMFEEYIIEGPLLREKVLTAMEEGKFELAVKYLFVKYIVLKDYDGKFFEYEIDEVSPPITIDKVELAIKNSKTKISNRILKTIQEIKKIAYNGQVYGSLDNAIEDLKYLAVTQCAI